MSKKRKAVRIIGIILLVITVFLLTVNIIPPKDNVKNNPFIVEKGQLPMIAAHRGGGLCNILYETLQKYLAYMDRIVIGTFHDVIEAEMKAKYPDIMTDDPLLLKSVLDSYR